MSVIQTISAAGYGTDGAFAPVSNKTQSAVAVGVPEKTVLTAMTTDPVAEAAALPDAIATLNIFVQPSAPSIQFLIDRKSGEPVVKVMDLQTHELLFQLPTGKALAIAKNLDQLSGLLIRQEI